MASSRAADPMSPGTPSVAVGLQMPTGEQVAAGSEKAFASTPQHKGLASSVVSNNH